MSSAPTPRDLDLALGRSRPREVAVPREAESWRRAAVLVPLVAQPTGVELLFILRPGSMPTHPSQVAFPGGALEPQDAEDSWRAATRETHEEIGLPPDAARVVTRLDDLPTISHFVVTPWVAWIPADAILRPSPREVDEVVRIPLAHLLDPARQRTMMGRWRDAPRRLRFYLGDRHVVWGATAEMVTNLLRALAPAAEPETEPVDG